MKVLIVNDNRYSADELKDFAKKIKQNIRIVDSINEAIINLEETLFDVIVIEIKSFSDLGLLKYINNNFANIKILLYADNSLSEAISIIKDANFIKLNNLNNLIELKKELLKIWKGNTEPFDVV